MFNHITKDFLHELSNLILDAENRMPKTEVFIDDLKEVIQKHLEINVGPTYHLI